MLSVVSLLLFAAPALQDPPADAAFEAGELVVVSAAVERFSLAGGIENREPVSGLDAVRFDADGLAAVYAFSEIEGMAGSTLYYRWSHEGEEVAVVPVHIGAERWRSHSSKFIEDISTGTWSVELRDGDGNRLAEADFTVHPRGAVGGQ